MTTNYRFKAQDSKLRNMFGHMDNKIIIYVYLTHVLLFGRSKTLKEQRTTDIQYLHE